MSAAENDEEMFQTLLAYKNLALDQAKHPIIMKDKTMVQFLAYSLDSSDAEVVETAIQTIELLVENSRNHNALKATFGLVEALKSISESVESDSKLRNLAKELYSSLNAQGPAYATRSRSKSSALTEQACGDRKPKLSSEVYTFLVFGLSDETRTELENHLIRIRGVISVVVDVKHQRCIVRAVEKITPEFLAESIIKNTCMEAHLVIKNKNNQEVLKNVLEEETKSNDSAANDLPPYLSEEESPVKEKAILSFDRLKMNAGSWIKTATSFLQNSFYW